MSNKIGNTFKKFGRKKAGTWGRPRKGNKRISNKAIRKFKLKEDDYA